MLSFLPLLFQQPNDTWAKIAAYYDDGSRAQYPLMVTEPPAAVAFDSAETDTTGEFIELVFDGNISALPVPSGDEFLVEVNAAAVAVTAVEVTAQTTLTLTLATLVENGNTVTIGYTAGTLLSLNGVPVATFAAESVTNNVP